MPGSATADHCRDEQRGNDGKDDDNEWEHGAAVRNGVEEPGKLAGLR